MSGYQFPCPACSSANTRVAGGHDSYAEGHGFVGRRRTYQCNSCCHRWGTLESTDKVWTAVVKAAQMPPVLGKVRSERTIGNVIDWRTAKETREDGDNG